MVVMHVCLTRLVAAVCAASRSGDWFYHLVEIMSLVMVCLGSYLIKVNALTKEPHLDDCTDLLVAVSLDFHEGWSEDRRVGCN